MTDVFERLHWDMVADLVRHVREDHPAPRGEGYRTTGVPRAQRQISIPDGNLLEFDEAIEIIKRELGIGTFSGAVRHAVDVTARLLEATGEAQR